MILICFISITSSTKLFYLSLALIKEKKRVSSCCNKGFKFKGLSRRCGRLPQKPVSLFGFSIPSISMVTASNRTSEPFIALLVMVCFNEED